MLTTRLNALVDAGVAARIKLPSPSNAQVYELTPVGRDLKPAIRELIRWGGHFLFPMRPGETFEPDWVLLGLDAIARREPTPARRIVLKLPHKTKPASFLVEGGPNGTQLSKSEGPGAATIEARFDTLLRIISTELPLEQAMSQRLARVQGSQTAAKSLPRLFDLSERRTRR